MVNFCENESKFRKMLKVLTEFCLYMKLSCLGSSHFWIQKIDDKNAFVKNKQKKYLVKSTFLVALCLFVKQWPLENCSLSVI